MIENINRKDVRPLSSLKIWKLAVKGFKMTLAIDYHKIYHLYPETRYLTSITYSISLKSYSADPYVVTPFRTGFSEVLPMSKIKYQKFEEARGLLGQISSRVLTCRLQIIAKGIKENRNS